MGVMGRGRETMWLFNFHQNAHISLLRTDKKAHEMKKALTLSCLGFGFVSHTLSVAPPSRPNKSMGMNITLV